MGRVDLTAGEAVFGIPAVPVWPEHDIESRGSELRHSVTLASFHSPRCSCGRPFGICYDLAAIIRTGHDPNVTLLHELTHAWQYYKDPDGMGVKHALELERYGYWDAPFEIEARRLSRMLDEAGVQVWFPDGRYDS